MLGVMDRLQNMQNEEREYELARISAIRGQIDEQTAGLIDHEVELSYCETTDWDRIYLSGDRAGEWHPWGIR